MDFSASSSEPRADHRIGRVLDIRLQDKWHRSLRKGLTGVGAFLGDGRHIAAQELVTRVCAAEHLERWTPS